MIARVVIVFLFIVMMATVGRSANTIKSVRLFNGTVTVEFDQDPGSYYYLEFSSDLVTWAPADMSLGIPSSLDIANGTQHGFFRAVPISKYSPLDSDGDGIDDVYELQHGLNPLDPHDATRFVPDGSGLTYYQEYLGLYAISSYSILQREGREVSVFNYGSPTSSLEGISREQSIFNFGSPSASIEAISREISIYNGQAVPVNGLVQIEGREVSVFNFKSPSATYEAVSREVSLYNGQAIPTSTIAEAESREISVFNFGSPSATSEAISREISVLNFNPN